MNAGSGTTLGGVGTVGSITTAGATLSPGDGATAGVLTDTGSLTLEQDSSSNASTYSVVIDGSTAGTGADHYSQTQVAGSITLNNPTLSVTLGPDFAPSIGTSFTIVQDSGSSPVTGTFNGLAQGSTIEVDGTTFAISYDGGANSNSIVLTELYPSTTNLSANPSTAVYGQPIDFTATVSGPNGDPAPTGTVDFYNGSTLLGSGTIASGIASLNNITNLPISDNQISGALPGRQQLRRKRDSGDIGDGQHGFRNGIAQHVSNLACFGSAGYLDGDGGRGKPRSGGADRVGHLLQQQHADRNRPNHHERRGHAADFEPGDRRQLDYRNLPG